MLSGAAVLDSFWSMRRIADGIRESCGQNEGAAQIAGKREQRELSGVANQAEVADPAIAVAALPEREHGFHSGADRSDQAVALLLACREGVVFVATAHDAVLDAGCLEPGAAGMAV